MWDDWYGDIMTQHHWCELEHNGRKVLYVHGRYEMSSGTDIVTPDLIQIIGYMDSEPSIDKKAQAEIEDIFRQQHSIQNISFWTGQISGGELV